MSTLSTELRNKLERTIVQARDVAEAGAKAALEALAVHHHEPYSHMSSEERKLRNHLRARARQLGDKQNRKGELEITHLVWECAYEHWHRMLFARFLAENDLLIEPEMGVAISLEECEELAKEEGKDLWTLASEFAQRMLPQIFRPDDPLLKITFAREHRLKLEQLLDGLESDVFTASDSLGWVYQFWQTKRKKEVNESGNKIGADELPTVTQLFTEPYMVNFLIHNTLGAWHAGRVLKANPALAKTAKSEEELRQAVALSGISWDFLRFVREEDGKGPWQPAAGTFEGWPKKAAELRVLDPCCGSGHFLVEAFHHLVLLRMKEEDLPVQEACDSVLKENLFGLEIDERCTQIAAFSLALAAWCYLGAGGYRKLPVLNIACSGLSIKAKKDEWLALSKKNTNLRIALDELYTQFKHAPMLGSLINIEAGLFRDTLIEMNWEYVASFLTKALSEEKNDEEIEMGVVARGIAASAKILSQRYHLVITNVPYRRCKDFVPHLRTLIERSYETASENLATVFLQRLRLFSKNGGTVACVMLSTWMYLKTYEKLRQDILLNTSIDTIADLGPGAFEKISGEVVDVILVVLSKIEKPATKDSTFQAIDVRNERTPFEKADGLRAGELLSPSQSEQTKNPDFRITLRCLTNGNLLQTYATPYVGLQNGDTPQFVVNFWEVYNIGTVWDYFQLTPESEHTYSGLSGILKWEQGQGTLAEFEGAYIKGVSAWGRIGIAIRQNYPFPCSLYRGWKYDQSNTVLIPKDVKYLTSLWTYCTSNEFIADIRKLDKKRNVTTSTFAKVPFNLTHWQKVASEKYPNGLPKPYSDDPTQWIFHGHPAKSDHPLQVAMARLLGYRWPAELDPEMELSDEQRDWVKKCEPLLEYTDEDGIVCISSMRGEEPAADRLREILSVAFGQDWSPAREQELIKATGANTAAFDDWLRDHFFEQHCKLFHHRPFIWHIWDGRRRDGFHALVNYHKLAEGNGNGRQLLENLTYSYLGDWITRQKDAVKQGEGGAEDRLAAALELQKRLIAIIGGEPPFDIFIRWKPIEEQPIGWEPDINDGVRLNIRPFMAQDIPGGRKGAGILRWKPNIKWNKDRGKEPFRPREQYPWFWKDGEFTGDRVNDIHLTNEEKSRGRRKNKHEGA